MTFQEFCKQDHEKKVKHFVRFCNATDTPPTTAAANEIFGICNRDSEPIVADAIKALAEVLPQASFEEYTTWLVSICERTASREHYDDLSVSDKQGIHETVKRWETEQ